MKNRSLTSLLLLLALSAALSMPLSACSLMSDDDEDPDQAAEQAIPDTAEPPPQMPDVEMAPEIDKQTQAWRPGYWAMIDGHFVWIPGKILSRPSPTAIWIASRWTHHDFGWAFEPGHWQ